MLNQLAISYLFITIRERSIQIKPRYQELVLIAQP